jgi:hypothetical protein
VVVRVRWSTRRELCGWGKWWWWWSVFVCEWRSWWSWCVCWLWLGVGLCGKWCVARGRGGGQKEFVARCGRSRCCGRGVIGVWVVVRLTGGWTEVRLVSVSGWVRCSGRRRKCGCVGVVGVGWGGGGLALERSGGARLWWCDRGRGLCVGERTRGRTMEVQREGGGVLVMLVVVVMGSHERGVTTVSRRVTTKQRHAKKIRRPCAAAEKMVVDRSGGVRYRGEVGEGWSWVDRECG